MAPLRILIVGGGIAGPAVALCLSRLGHQCTVIERFPAIRANGQQVDLREQGIAAAELLGILDAVRRRSVKEAGVQFVDEHDTARASFKKSPPGERQSFTSEFEIMRGELCRLLFDFTESTVTYKFGMTVADFENQHDHVQVTLSDGTTQTYDLLIGADGDRSRIQKRLLTSQDLHRTRALGVCGCYFTVPREPGEDGDFAKVCHFPGQRFAMMRWHSQDLAQAYLFSAAHVDEVRDVLKQGVISEKKTFQRIFGDCGWQVPRLLKAMQIADDFYAQEVLQVRCERWSAGRVVLVGDAGYAPSPFTGMGTSLALVGACILAGEIARRPDDLPAALAAYEKELRPYAEEVQSLPPGFPNLAFMKSKLGIRIFHLILYFITIFVEVVRLSLLGRVWNRLTATLPKLRKEWTLPAYPELAEAMAKSKS